MAAIWWTCFIYLTVLCWQYDITIATYQTTEHVVLLSAWWFPPSRVSVSVRRLTSVCPLQRGVGLTLEKERRVGDPSFQGWSGVQWVPSLVYVHTCIYTYIQAKHLKSVMGCWPVYRKESPGIQSQSPQHAGTDWLGWICHRATQGHQLFRLALRLFIILFQTFWIKTENEGILISSL